MKKLLSVFALCFAIASLNGRSSAFAQMTLSAYSAQSGQCLYWDEGNAERSGGGNLQVYPAYQAAQTSQSYNWVAASSGSNNYWYIQNATSGLYLYDNGSAIGASTTLADQFTIEAPSGSSVGYVLDVSTGRYLEQPSNTPGAVIVTGSTPYAWTFSASGSSSSFSGCGGSGGGNPVAPSTSGVITYTPTGDSITLGSATPGTESQGGYRCPLLWDLQTKFGSNIQPVGYSQFFALPSVSAPVTACSAVQWAGYWGQDIAQIQDTIATDGDIASNQPNYITFLGGTNNIVLGTPGTAGSDLANLLEYFFQTDTQLVGVVVSTIPPFYPGASAVPDVSQWQQWNSEVPAVNQQIINTVQQFQAAGFPVVLNDFYTAANTNPAYYLGPDGIHPAVPGYNLLGDQFYSELAGFIAAGSAPYAAKSAVAAELQTVQAVARIAANKN